MFVKQHGLHIRQSQMMYEEGQSTNRDTAASNNNRASAATTNQIEDLKSFNDVLANSNDLFGGMSSCRTSG